jgi:DNA-binding protein H-NS
MTMTKIANTTMEMIGISDKGSKSKVNWHPRPLNFTCD